LTCNEIRYADQAAFNSHLSSKPVVEMFDWINSANIYSRPAEFYSLDSSPDLVSIRPELATTKDPYVVVRHTNFQDRKVDQGLSALEKVVSAAKNESGTLLCGVYTDPAAPKRLFTIDACESKEYWSNTHVKSEAYVESEKVTKTVGNVTELSFLKMMGGFLYKPELMDASLRLWYVQVMPLYLDNFQCYPILMW